jgi:hypothetical protein
MAMALANVPEPEKVDPNKLPASINLEDSEAKYWPTRFPKHPTIYGIEYAEGDTCYCSMEDKTFFVLKAGVSVTSVRGMHRANVIEVF